MPKDSLPFLAAVENRRAKRMDEIDKMAPELRKCVHDYGLAIVDALLKLGVKKPNQIRHVVETILDEFSPTRGTYSSQGQRTRVRRGAP